MFEPNKRVARGVRYLDKKAPGWEDKITRPLDLNSNANCVIGQVFGGFFAYTARKFFIPMAWPVYATLGFFTIFPWTYRRGFCWPGDTADWERVIAERRAKREAEALAEAENLLRAEYLRAWERASRAEEWADAGV